MKDFYNNLILEIDLMLKEKYQFATNNDDGVKLLKDISNDIQEITATRLQEQSSSISKEAILWLKNSIFQKVKIADGLSVSDLIFMNNYELSDLSNDDIFLLSSLLEKSEFNIQLKNELKKRKYAN